MSRMALRLVQAVVLCGVLIAGVRPAAAIDTRAVGLGVGVGASVPWGQLQEGGIIKPLRKLNSAWGFYVNIPLISSFHIMPHAELYQVAENVTATDIGMAFKFIIQGEKLRPYVGLNVGGTNIVSDLNFNVGALGGLSFKLYQNLDAFGEVRYMQVIRDVPEGGNIKNAQAFVGLLFRFER